jgi:hypothetical protein
VVRALETPAKKEESQVNEKSPEQKVREYYEAFKETSDLNEHDRTVVHTIKMTLKLLGITIKGVNAK